MKGLVVKSTGSWYKVRLNDGKIIDARSRGKLRTANSRNTNHITVGDLIEIDETGEDFSISKIQDRKNYIIRKSTKLSKETHIIAANIDLAIIVTTLKEPKLKFGFVDRFLVTAQAYQIPAIIVCNKTDLLNDKEKAYLKDLRAAYREIGYESEAISVSNNEGINKIQELTQDKITLFSGTSGVGKSSLLNKINPDISAKVSNVSASNEKGQHTTTFAEMHEINPTSFIIDTPGLKSFGLIDMEPEELKDYFPEMVRFSENCKFGNCKHLNEPGCAVKPEFEESRLPIFRYENYVHLYEELKALKKND